MPFFKKSIYIVIQDIYNSNHYIYKYIYIYMYIYTGCTRKNLTKILILISYDMYKR